MSNSTAQSLVLEVHSHLAAFIEPGNTLYLDSFPLYIFTVCNSIIYLHITLPPKKYHTERIPTGSTYTDISYCKENTPSHISCNCMEAHFHMLLHV
jgi:hypothetical protein